MEEFTKKAKSFEGQLQILEGRGLIIDNKEFALKCLSNINYYRLSLYRFPLSTQGDPDKFLDGIKFSDLWELYSFDRTIRRLILDASKRVEISVRTKWAYSIGHKYGPFAYEDSNIFENKTDHLKTLGQIYNMLSHSREDFVKHFREKYGLNRPPIWALCEICSFGQISHLLKNLQRRADRKLIAEPFNIDEKVLVSFVEHLSQVRNHAAHHSRLWNRKLVKIFILPKDPDDLSHNLNKDNEARRRIYNTLTMLLYLLQIIEPNASLQDYIIKHVQSVPKNYLPHMGFPEDWSEKPLWKNV